MKKLIFYLSLCTVPISASAADIFNSDGAFTIAKAVKLGRSATSLGGGLSDLAGQNNLSGHQSNACYVGYYSSDNGCQACSAGCVECESKTECTKCDINNLWDLFDNTCKKSVCSWNHNNTAYLATNCTDVDGYGRSSTIIVPNTNPTYDTVNIRFWDKASVSGGAFTTSVLRSTSHTSSQLETLSSVITFNNPVTVTDKVVLQEDSSDAASGVKMVFNGGLKGNPVCKVKKQKSSSGCGYASCQADMDTDAICTCTSSECVISDPIPQCDAGYYASGTSCVACPAGTYSSGGTATSCTACSDGTYSTAGASGCTSCTTLYTSAGSNTCTSCTTDGICLGSNSGSSSSSSSGSSSTMVCPNSHADCPTGYECTNGGYSCKVCSAGSNLAMGNCNCPSGTKSNGSGGCS